MDMCTQKRNAEAECVTWHGNKEQDSVPENWNIKRRNEAKIDTHELEEKKEEIWLCPITQTPITPEQITKNKEITQRCHRKVGLHNDCRPT